MLPLSFENPSLVILHLLAYFENEGGGGIRGLNVTSLKQLCFAPSVAKFNLQIACVSVRAVAFVLMM